jgi:hypothetical protein
MDRGVDAQFRKDRSGRLVFVPFTLKGKCYFVDSKADEEKLRAFVKMYRSATTLLSWTGYPSVYFPGLILDRYVGMTPRGHRLAFAMGVPMIFWLVIISLLLMLWGLYKQAVPSFTTSLTEVGPDIKSQLNPVHLSQRRLALVFAGAALLLVGVTLFALVQYHPRRPCPTQPHVCQPVEPDSNQSRPPR